METESKVSCMCCKKKTATVIVKDNGLRTYPACAECVRSLYRPQIVRQIMTSTETTTAKEVVKFTVGQTYTTRSACDYDCIFSITVAARTAKTITTAEGRKYRISKDLTEYYGAEAVKEGAWSFAPIFRADRN